MEQAKKVLESTDGVLVDIRSWKEFIGDSSGYKYIGKKGHIKGAIFGNSGSDAYHIENYRNIDQRMREFNEIEQIWQLKGITKNKYIAFYCGTGWRASEAYFYAYLMGFTNISIYDGGWYEWSRYNEDLIELDEPEANKLSDPLIKANIYE